VAELTVGWERGRAVSPHTVRLALLTLALFAIAPFLEEKTPAQVLFVSLAVCMLAALFLERPEAFPVCAIVSVASGGLELELSGSTPKVFFATIVVIAYGLSVAIRKSLSRSIRAQQSSIAPAQPFASGANTVAILLAFYLVLQIPSFGQMQVVPRSVYLLLMRMVTLVGVIVLAREKRLLLDKRNVLFATSLVGMIIAGGYLVNAIRVYSAGSFMDLAMGLALKDNTVQVGLLGTTNTIASFLAFTLPLAVAYALQSHDAPGSLPFAIGSIVVQSFGLIGTASRGGVVALIGGMLIAALVCHTSVAQLRRLVGFLVVSVLVIVLGYLIIQNTMRENFASRFALTTITEYATRRFQLWDSSWRAFIDNPVFGIGVGNVGFFDRDFGTGNGSESHNLVLQTLAEEGLLAAMILVGVLFMIVKRNITATKVQGVPQLWVVVALISALLNSLIEPTFWQPAFAALFWVTAIYMYRHTATMLGQSKRGEGSGREHFPRSRTMRSPAAGEIAPLPQE
jgi:O-antigen ligase